MSRSTSPLANPSSPHALSAPAPGAASPGSLQEPHDALHGLTYPEDMILKAEASMSTDRSSETPSAPAGGWRASAAALLQRVLPYGGLASNCFSLASVTLGGGIISMPSSFATSGLLAAVLYLAVITIMTVYTMTLMCMAMEQTGCRTFEALGDTLFGRGWGYVVGFVLWLSCIGTAIAYVSAVSGLLEPMLRYAPDNAAFLRTPNGTRVMTAVVWAVLMLPLVIPKRINSLRYISMFACMCVVYFVGMVVVHSASNGMREGMRGEMRLFTSGNKAIYGLSIFVFAYMCQGVAFSVYFECRPRPSVRQVTLASAIALGTCMVLYILAGLFGYFDFADATSDSVLYNFDPVREPYVFAAYIGMLIKLCAAFAMNMLPVRNFTYACLGWDLDTLPYAKHVLTVGSIAAVTLVAGLFIPSVNLAFGLVGSLCGGFIGFIFPALFRLYGGRWTLRTVGVVEFVSIYVLLFCGVIAIVFGTVATIYSSFIDV